MALPPIISNLPIFKLLKTDAANATQKPDAPEKKAAANLPKDVVQLSDAALKKLDEEKKDVIRTDAQARETADDVRAELESDQDRTLGLDEDRLIG